MSYRNRNKELPDTGANRVRVLPDEPSIQVYELRFGQLFQTLNPCSPENVYMKVKPVANLGGVSAVNLRTGIMYGFETSQNVRAIGSVQVTAG